MKGEERPFVEHLEELRRTVISCLLALLIAYPVGYAVTPFVIDWLTAWCFPTGMGKLYYFGPMDVLWLKMQTALIIALMIAFPWFLYQMWGFVLPALYENERKVLALGIAISVMLFAIGAGFSLFVMLPLAMSFSGSFATAQVQPMLGLSNVLSLAGWLTLSFGLMFQTPIVVLLAVKIGLVSSEQLKNKRPYVATLILIIAAVLTPPDVVSQVMLAIPTWLLFEGGLLLAQYVEPKERPAFRESMN